MTLDELRSVIIRAADGALRSSPGDSDRCARDFIAMLSGSINLQDQELADKVYSVLQHKDQRS